MGSGLRRARVDAGLCASRSAALSKLRMAGAWDEPEEAKASLELMQIRCAQVDVKEFKTWIQKWPKGLSKDGYGLPKLMLPVATEVACLPSSRHLPLLFGTATP